MQKENKTINNRESWGFGHNMTVWCSLCTTPWSSKCDSDLQSGTLSSWETQRCFLPLALYSQPLLGRHAWTQGFQLSLRFAHPASPVITAALPVRKCCNNISAQESVFAPSWCPSQGTLSTCTALTTCLRQQCVKCKIP